ncbi:MAG: hypothetical protein LBT46_03970 [Planctomycetaceae bacterium]|jgi:hypothetical protein|nr:hypothetical protein [Planctomycetaceae bacterium]
MLKSVTNVGQYFRSQVAALSKPVIDSALNAAHEAMRKGIAEWKRNYLLNIIESLTLEILIIGIALICHYFLTMNCWAVFIISLLVLTIMFRSLVRYALMLWKYRVYRNLAGMCLKTFGQTFVKYRSIERPLQEVIRCVFLRLYDEKVAVSYRKIHSFVSVIGVPSRDELAETVVAEFYKPVRAFAVRLVLCEAGGFTLFYVVFFCLLKNYVFGITAHMSTAEVILFPFTVAVPALVRMWL